MIDKTHISWLLKNNPILFTFIGTHNSSIQFGLIEPYI
ncbi:uncharacterized protein METZ01_LOCUS135325 [marine metagenome]|uniref:Uncharacterized protein n=1 Tax=marine metagenome TaxID=408172 RepID=A0A381Z0N4_9ZZZZ